MAAHYRRFLGDEKEYVSGSECPLLCPPPPPPPSNHQTANILIISLSVLAVVFLFISYFAIRRFRSRRRNSPPAETDTFREDIIDELHGPVIDHPIWYIRTIGLPQSAIDSIEVFRFKKGEKLTEGSDCSVCLTEFEEDEDLRLLPKCSHAFHVPCIDTWLRAHTNCPVCRAAVMSGGANEVISEEVSSSNSESVEEDGEEREVEMDEREGENGRNWRVRVMSDLAEYRVKIDPEMEPVRRSVSMNVTSASAAYQCSER